MRRSLIGAALAAALLGWPVVAQDDGGRVLVDATLRVAPDEVEAHCLPLDAGTLEVSVEQVDGRPEHQIGWPRFALGPKRAGPARADEAPVIEGLKVTAARTTTALPVTGGTYCYSLSVAGSPDIDGLSARERAAYAHSVALKITLTPH